MSTYQMIIPAPCSKNFRHSSLSSFDVGYKLEDNSIVLLYFVNKSQIYRNL